MEKINIAELLKDCPKGMELDCVLFDGVVFDEIDDDEYCGCPIVIKTKEGETWNLTSTGCWDDSPSAKCVIFPKGKTTWEGFVPPCKFKDGDVISNGICICIYNGNENDKYYGCYVSVGHIDFPDYFINHPLNNYFTKENSRLATEEEKEKLFQAIKEEGYYWDAENNMLEVLLDEPKFKVGDRVKQIGSPRSYIIRSVEFDRYILHNNQFIRFKDEHIYELVSNKFDINTLIPFESKVLVRHNKDNKWTGSFFSFIDRDLHSHCYKFVTTADTSYPMMIPFKGNEYLLGKTDDCQDFYKIWE